MSTDAPATPVPRLALRHHDAASALGISKRKLSELIADQTSGLPIVRLGKCVLFPVKELEDWLSQQVMKGVRR